MSAKPLRSDTLALEGVKVARRRWQKGQIIEHRGRWYVRYYADRIVEGKLERYRANPVELGPSKGPAKLTRRQAEARAAEVMAGVNAGGHRPQSLLTVAEFVAERFLPEYVWALKPAGQKHYKTMLKHVVEALGPLALRDVTTGHVRRAMAQKAEQYSRSTVTHFRNVTHAVFNYAEECGFFGGRNPASRVRVPEAAAPAKRVEAYTLEQLGRILSLLESPLREMATLSVSTSMHAAELAGLRVRHVNLGTEPRSIEGETVPGGALLVCESIYLNKRSSPKASSRRRVLPIPESLRGELARMVAGREGWMPVFVMPRTLKLGKVSPVDPHNVTNRVFRPLADVLGFAVNWHRLRHTHATFTDSLGLEERDRMRMLGHTDARTTAIYTHQHERLAAAAEAIYAKIKTGGGNVQ